MQAAAFTFKEFVGDSSSGIIGAINQAIVPTILALAFLFFVYKVVEYFFFKSEGSEEKIKEGREFVMWGILGLVVLFSVWALVGLLLSTLGIKPT